MISDKSNKPIIVTNIQRFSLHDGPGIRTTVFLKGCGLRCPWCSNPENLVGEIQYYIKDGVKGTYGRYMSCSEIYSEVIKDKVFYGIKDKIGEKSDYSISLSSELEHLPGGVTFSGGEALLQIEELEPLLSKLKNDSIHIAVETSLFVPQKKLKVALKYIDLFYVDIKLLDEKECGKVLDGNLELYLRNVDLLFKANVPIIIRIPVIYGYTDKIYNRILVIEFLKHYRPLKVELIKEHNLGASKYASLSLQIPDYRGVSDQLMEKFKKEIECLGIVTEICKI